MDTGRHNITSFPRVAEHMEERSKFERDDS